LIDIVVDAAKLFDEPNIW